MFRCLFPYGKSAVYRLHDLVAAIQMCELVFSIFVFLCGVDTDRILILRFAMRLYHSNKSMRKGSAGTRCLSPGLRIYIFVLLLLHRKIKKCPNKNNIYRPELVSPSQKKGEYFCLFRGKPMTSRAAAVDFFEFRIAASFLVGRRQ